MTEQEWLTSNDPQTMLEFLRGKVSDRKLRLFDCASGRSYLHRMYSEHDRRILEVMERYNEHDRRILDVEERCADGDARIEDLIAAYEAAGNDPVDASDAAHFDPYLSAYYSNAHYVDRFGSIPEEVLLAQSALLRDLLGNPFRPVTINSAWLSWNDATVQKVAQAIYDERAFDRMPILADALEEAGCTDADILNHCRRPGEHVRGCWVIDLVLGKE
jgi:hypothetical protein